MTFRLANIDGRAALVGPDDRWYDLEQLTGGELTSDPMEAIARTDDLKRYDDIGFGNAEAGGTLADAADAGRLGPPVPRPTNVFGVGLNYRSHAEETGREPPTTPLVFTKFPTCLVGPRSDVELDVDSADYEVELVVVIGRRGRRIPAASAWGHIAGLTVGQDISDRTLQFAGTPPHFDLGKSRDTYGPIGPVVVSVDAFDDPDDLALTCDINGERRQDDRTSNLIISVPALVEYLSAILTLQPGDLIFTGTPAGVGAGTGTFLKPGDEIVSTIEGIGTMVNRCV